MFRSIVAKELTDTVRSLRFIVGWLVMFVLMVAAVLLLSTDVRQRQERLDLVARSQDEYVSKYAHLNRIGYVLQTNRPPERSEVFFRGLENEAEAQSFFSDPLGKLFTRLDFLFIISLLLSLLSIIFTYDAICGEREDGTLKLLHANPVSRATVVLGKWVGLWIAISVPFLAVYLFAILLGSVVSGLPLTLEFSLELGLIAAASLLYVAFFLCLGLFVSGLVRQPGTSILVLLFLWVVFTMVIPNTSPLIASQMRPISSVNEVERQARELTDTIRDNLVDVERDKIKRKLRERYAIPGSATNFNDQEQFKALGWTEEQFKEFSEVYTSMIREALDRVTAQQRAKAQALLDELQRQVDAQSELALLISLLSPSSSFTYLGTDLASVGLRGEEYYENEVLEYNSAMHAFIDQRWQSEEERLGRKIGYEEFIDLSGRPRFRHQPEPIDGRISHVLPYAAHLALATLVVLALAVIAYLRYDVR